MGGVVSMGVRGRGKTPVGLASEKGRGRVFPDADDLHPTANIGKIKRGEPLDDACRAHPGRFIPESLIDSQSAALETPAGDVSIDTDPSADRITATIIHQLNLPTQ